MSLDYTKIENRFHLYTRELDEKNKSFIYGEVDPSLIIELLGKEINFQEGDTFLDIGSGCGKMIISLGNNTQFYNNYFTGIEIHETRYNESINLLNTYDMYENVEFILGDYKILYFRNYNVLYCCNTIFGEKENNDLFEKIKTEFVGYFILFEYDNILKEYLIGSYTVKTSWNSCVTISLFKKLN